MKQARKIMLAGLLCIAAAAAQDAGYFSPDQLDNLLAPIALYPDPLLAQVLLAATFPDQIDETARYLRGGGNPGYIDSQGWDVSVKAVAHYPEVLYMLADKLDWTTALGQAYVEQSTDVMASVQRLRQEAYAAGNLTSDPEEQVIDTNGYIQIWPAQPQYIYVPVYDPAVIYFGRGIGLRFSARFPIGVWLDYDFDWRNRRVFYHGWSGGEGWEARSRPFIHQSDVYVNNRFRNPEVNRAVVDRPVNYSSLNRYNAVHRNINYNNVRAGAQAGRSAAPAPQPAQNHAVNNKIIERNFNPNDSRIQQFRGHPEPQPAINQSRPELGRTQINREPPQPQRIPERVTPQPQPVQRMPERVAPQPQPVQRMPERGGRPEFNRQPQPEPVRPAAQPQPQRMPERPAPMAFGGNRGAFNPGIASERGQASRAEMARPAPTRAAPPPPASRPAPEHRGRGGRQ